MAGLEPFAIKGLIFLFKAGKMKFLLIKLAGIVQSQGFLTALSAALSVGTVVGGVVLTGEMINYSENFFKALHKNDRKKALISFLNLAKCVKTGVGGAEDILGAAIANTSISFDEEKLVKESINQIGKEVRKKMNK